MTRDACRRCGAPAPGATLCATCTTALRHTLHAVPDVHADLTITRTRQDRLTTSRIGVVTRTADGGLPWAQHASAALQHLRTVLAAEVRHQVDTRRLPPPRDAIDAMAAWLVEHLGLIRVDDTAAETYEAIDSAVRRCRRVIDRPPQRSFIGPCDHCSADLYARPKAPVATCTGCGARYDTDVRREWLLREAEDQLLTATEIARALPGLLDEPLSVGTIRSWASRGRLVAHGWWHGRPVYRVGDVLDLVAADPRRAADTG